MTCVLRLAMAALTAAAALVLPTALPTALISAAQGDASCPWLDAGLSPATRTAKLLAAMTLDDEIQMVTGVGLDGVGPHALENPNLGAAGAILPNARLCIPALVLNDAGAGVGDQQTGVTAFPDGIAQVASWDPSLARTYGAALGREMFTKGANVALAPGVDIARTPLGGRNFEYAGEDPYLAGRAAAAEIEGIQSQHVLATVKHFALNDQETDRNTESSDADERTMEEIDFPAFEAAVRAGVGSVMCSYNRVNGTYACENPSLLTKYLKKQFAFRGFVMSDWLATHSTAPSADAGLDMEMPGDTFGYGEYFGDKLKTAVSTGSVPKSRLDDMVRRVLLEMFTYGLFDHVPVEGVAAKAADATTPASIAVATRVAQDGAVLLKNDGALPLAGPGRKIAVIGAAANPLGATFASQGYGSGHVPEVGYQPGVVSPLDALTRRAAQAGDVVTYADGTNSAAAAAVAAAADTAIVFVNDVSVEGADRPDLDPHSGTCVVIPSSNCAYDGVDQNALVAAVAAANPKTVVVLQSGGPVSMPWLASVKSVVEGWLPGQVDGDALAPLLFGDVNFSGKLPVTFPKRLADGPLRTAAQYPGATVAGDSVGPHVRYSEGLLIGYRWYAAKGIAPLFPFGFGLSYTSFRYSGLKVAASATSTTVTATVTNTGKRAGAEVAQLYVSFPSSTGEPPLQLKGFQKIALGPGQSGTVRMNLDPRAFSVWRTSTHSWFVAPGCYGVSVGGSSASRPLHASLPRGGGSC